jgi:hypothetical protein
MGKWFKRVLEWKAIKAVFRAGRWRGHGDRTRTY